MEPTRVVLIHGINTTSRTWDDLIKRASADIELHSHVEFHKFSYDSSLLRFTRGKRPSYTTAALQLRTELQPLIDQEQPFAFLTHSQGGLVLQHMLHHVLKNGEALTLARARCAIFVACPNLGSPYLLSSRRLTRFLTRSAQEQSLEPFDEGVADVHSYVIRHIEVSDPTDKTQLALPVLAIAAASDPIVPRGSAFGNFKRTDVVPGTHTSVLRSDDALSELLRILRRELLDHSNHGPSPHSEAYLNQAVDTNDILSAHSNSSILINLADIPRADAYLARESVSQELSDMIAIHSITGICASPATGKSELALRWAESEQHNYRIVWWIDATNETTIGNGMASLQIYAGITTPSPPYTAVEQFLNQRDALLIFDGLQDESDLARLRHISRSAQGKILITTNLTADVFGPGAISLPEMDDVDSLQLTSLLLSPSDFTDNDRQTLALHFSGQPMAIAQACAYLRDTGTTSVTHSLELFKEDPSRVIARGARSGASRKSLSSVWERLFALIDATSSLKTVHALAAMKLLGPSAVVRGLWEAAVGFALSSSDELGDEFSTKSLTAEIQKYSLITTSTDRVTCHQLLASYCWQQCDQERVASAALRSIETVTQYFRMTSRGTGFYEILQPLRVISRHYSRIVPRLLADVLIQASAYAIEIELTSAGLELAATAAEVAEADPSQELLIPALANYSACLVKVRQFDEAIEIAQDCLILITEDRTKAYQKAQIYAVLADAYWEANDLESCLPYASAAVEQLVDIDVATDAGLMTSVNVRFVSGKAYFAANKPNAGELIDGIWPLLADDKWAMWRENLRADLERFAFANKIKIHLPPPGAPDTPTASHATASQEGDSAESSIPTQSRIGTSFTTLAITAENLLKQGLSTQAEMAVAEMERVIDINGPWRDFRLAEVRQNMARVLIHANRPKEAMQSAKAALSLIDNLPAGFASSTEVRATRSGIIVNLAAATLGCAAIQADSMEPVPREEIAALIPLLREARLFDAREFGDDHDEYAWDIFTLAQVLVYLEQRDAATKWFKKARAIWSRPGVHYNASQVEDCNLFITMMQGA